MGGILIQNLKSKIEMPRPKGQTLTQKDIVEAAIACIQKEGEAALGVNRVARELGIQPPSLYNHIAGNEELRRLVVVEGWRRCLAACLPPATEIEDGRERLKKSAYRFRRFVQENPSLYAVLMRYKLDLSVPECATIFQQVIKFYTEILEPFGFSSDEIVHTSRLATSVMHGFVSVEQAGLFTYSLSTDKSFEWIVNTIIDALEQKKRLKLD